MEDQQLVEQVRALRVQGRSPNQIARALGVRPAVVAPIVRALAEQEVPREEPVVGCWINAGWSVGLDVPDHRGWSDEPEYGREASGLAGVVVARQRPHRSQVTVAGYLVDTYCLGGQGRPWADQPGRVRAEVVAAAVLRHADRITADLDASVGEGNYDFVSPVGVSLRAAARDDHRKRGARRRSNRPAMD